jgi:hypothetical protein
MLKRTLDDVHAAVESLGHARLRGKAVAVLGHASVDRDLRAAHGLTLRVGHRHRDGQEFPRSQRFGRLQRRRVKTLCGLAGSETELGSCGALHTPVRHRHQ